MEDEKLSNHLKSSWKVSVIVLLCIIAAITSTAQEIDPDRGLFIDYLAAKCRVRSRRSWCSDRI